MMALNQFCVNLFFNIFMVILILPNEVKSNPKYPNLNNNQSQSVVYPPNSNLFYSSPPSYNQNVYPNHNFTNGNPSPYNSGYNSNNQFQQGGSNNMNYLSTTPSSYYPLPTTFPNLNVHSNNGMCYNSLNKTNQCCDGYKPKKHNPRKCVPICTDCKNGHCSAPEQCECFPGFVKSLDGECVHTCPLGCLNGNCHSNGLCTCHQGYYHSHYSNQICVPHCNNPCAPSMNCTAPNSCECNKGYMLNRQTYKCEPVCEPDCLHGECVGPNKCECFKGYKLINRVCQANCTKGCENGLCIQHEYCSCNAGWTLNSKENKCIPVCTNCKHGKCIAPEECKCNTGYEKHQKGCRPTCDTTCSLHGECIAPHLCVCRYPYKSSLFGGCSRKY